MDSNNNDKRAYMRTPLTKTIIFCGVVLILVIVAVMKFPFILYMLLKIARILRPLIVGGFIALILNRPVNKLCELFQKPFDRRYERKLAEFFRNGGTLDNLGGNTKTAKSKKGKNMPPKRNRKIAFMTAIVTCYVLGIGLIIALFSFVVPQFLKSLETFAGNFNSYYDELNKFVQSNFKRLNALGIEGLKTQNLLDAGKKQLDNFISQIPAMVGKATNYATTVIGVIIDVVIGVIFSIYILAGKRDLKSGATALTKKMFKEKQYNAIAKYAKITIDTFANFFNGQLLEAFILGALCFIGMTIFGFDYAVIISVIIGLTNMIPIVGPWIGAIPSIFLLLLADTDKAIWFAVFLIILQQIESNIIYPRVVGNSVGLPGIWILFAILVGGGLGNVLGMIIGVPLMSIIYCSVKASLETENFPSSADKVE